MTALQAACTLTHTTTFIVIPINTIFIRPLFALISSNQYSSNRIHITRQLSSLTVKTQLNWF